MDLTFQVPMQYCSLQHQTLLSPSYTTTTWHFFCFGSASSFLLKLFLHSSPVACWTATDLGGFIFQCHIFLTFDTVHGVLKARMLKWFAICFFSGPHLFRTLHPVPSILGGPTWHSSYFIELGKVVVLVIRLFSFL